MLNAPLLKGRARGGAVLTVLRKLGDRAAVLGHDDLVALFADLAEQVRADPAAGARAVLRQYDVYLDAVFKPAAGHRYVEGALRKAAFEAASLRWTLYQQTLKLWHATAQFDADADRRALAGMTQDIREGGGRYFFRYETGGHQMVCREDEISVDQMRQAALGPAHMGHMLIGLQAELGRRGVNAHVSNITYDQLTAPRGQE